jgi:hypothetical protein
VVVYDGIEIPETDRDIPDNFRADIDPAILKTDEREIAEIVVVVVAMDHPPVKGSGCISRIVHKKKVLPTIIDYLEWDRSLYRFIMVTGDEGNRPVQLFPVVMK